jgi:hypothetical protein
MVLEEQKEKNKGRKKKKKEKEKKHKTLLTQFSNKIKNMVNIKVISFIYLLIYLPSPKWNDNDFSAPETYCSATDAS